MIFEKSFKTDNKTFGNILKKLKQLIGVNKINEKKSINMKMKPGANHCCALLCAMSVGAAIVIARPDETPTRRPSGISTKSTSSSNSADTKQVEQIKEKLR